MYVCMYACIFVYEMYICMHVCNMYCLVMSVCLCCIFVDILADWLWILYLSLKSELESFNSLFCLKCMLIVDIKFNAKTSLCQIQRLKNHLLMLISA